MTHKGSDYFYNRTTAFDMPLTEHGDDPNEKTRLQQPVQLQPSWEEKNLPEDELNFKNLSMEEAELELKTPPDKHNLVYLTFLLHGIGVLMPWNMFITADKYFTGYKLHKDYIGGEDFPYLANFMQYLTFCSQVPNVLFNWMNIFIQIGGNLTTRIVWSISFAVVIVIITITLAMTDTRNWAYGFFYITMICVAVLNMANGIYQNTIFGMAAKLPSKYTGAVVLGSNICGTFTTVMSIVTDLLTDNKRMATVYYFITALFVLLVCFDTYFALPLNRFYRHHEIVQKKQQEKRNKTNLGRKERIPYYFIFKKALPQLYNVYLCLFVTLAIFPALQSNIQPSNIFFLGKHFTAITCFLTFNVTAMLGSLLTSFIQWPGPKYLWIPVTLRVLYIPFYIFCNYKVPGEERILPVVIHDDWTCWVVSITMGLTSGYLSSLAMMYAPRLVEDRFAPTAGMFGAAALITGIFSGIVISFLWPWIVTHVGY